MSLGGEDGNNWGGRGVLNLDRWFREFHGMVSYVWSYWTSNANVTVKTIV